MRSHGEFEGIGGLIADAAKTAFMTQTSSWIMRRVVGGEATGACLVAGFFSRLGLEQFRARILPD